MDKTLEYVHRLKKVSEQAVDIKLSAEEIAKNQVVAEACDLLIGLAENNPLYVLALDVVEDEYKKILDERNKNATSG